MIKLRTYQKPACAYALEHLESENNSLLVIPTGGGKTFCFSYVIGKLMQAHADNGEKLNCLFLVHREEISNQNRKAFRNLNTTIPTSVFQGGIRCCSQATFAMVQTAGMVWDKLPRFDIVCVDECHRGLAETYTKIINKQKELAKEEGKPFYLFGVTATPSRSDEQSLFELFTNFYQVSLGDLIECKALVRPTFLDMTPLFSTENGITGLSSDEYGKLVLKAVERAIRENKSKIVIFCPNHERIADVVKYVRMDNVSVLSEQMNAQDRQDKLHNFMMDENELSILINVDICTEGFDYQPTDCVILARSIGDKTKGLYIQMIGRALRGIDPTRYRTLKKDALVIDLGGNVQRHGDLTPIINQKTKKKGERKEGLTLEDILGDDYEAVMEAKEEHKENVVKTGRVVEEKEFIKNFYTDENPFIETIELPDGRTARVAFHNNIGLIAFKDKVFIKDDSNDWRVSSNDMKAMWDYLKKNFPKERDRRPVSNVMYSLIGTDYSLVGLDWYRGQCILALKTFLKGENNGLQLKIYVE